MHACTRVHTHLLFNWPTNNDKRNCNLLTLGISADCDDILDLTSVKSRDRYQVQLNKTDGGFGFTISVCSSTLCRS